MKRVKRPYFEVPNECDDIPLGACKVIWSNLDADHVKCREGYHCVPRSEEPWHYETRDFNEAKDFFDKFPPMNTYSNPFKRFSIHEFRFLDVKGSPDKPLSCTVMLSEGRFEKFCFA